MKIAVLSDLHGNKYTLQKFFDYVENVQKVDKIVYLGDIFGYYYYQDQIIDILRSKSNLISILGNHDKYFLDILSGKETEEQFVAKYGNTYKNCANKIKTINVEYIKSLQQSLVLKCQDLTIGFFHGSPENNLEGRVYPDTVIENTQMYKDFDYLFLGHTHHKMIKKVGKTLIVNPGSLGQQRDGKGCSFVIFDTTTGCVSFEIVEFDTKLLLNDINVFDNGNSKLSEVLLRRKIL